jgi:hypothetical protein
MKTFGKIAVVGAMAYLMNLQTDFAYQFIIRHGLNYFVSM